MAIPVFVGIIILAIVAVAGTIGSTILSFKHMAKNPNAMYWAGRGGMYYHW